MDKVEVTWSNSIKVWWSFFWRATLFGGIAGALAGGIAGGILGAMGKLELIESAASIIGYVVWVPISMWCVKTVLSKDYKDFSTCLVKKYESST
ncbi:MAG: hypothetical protein P8R04_07670 [Gammaproteobacteria bacterium]|nr:hypothetical protein [Gammaproteobacteria bacterium]